MRALVAVAALGLLASATVFSRTGDSGSPPADKRPNRKPRAVAADLRKAVDELAVGELAQKQDVREYFRRSIVLRKQLASLREELFRQAELVDRDGLKVGKASGVFIQRGRTSKLLNDTKPERSDAGASSRNPPLNKEDEDRMRRGRAWADLDPLACKAEAQLAALDEAFVAGDKPDAARVQAAWDELKNTVQLLEAKARPK